MYIYIHVENYAREFDSKLLLSLLAVKKDTKVLLGNVNKLVQKKNIPFGIFHNKDVTASKELIKIFKNAKKNGLIITSQDEEIGLEGKTPDDFMEKRYSQKTLSIVDKIFTFGEYDTNFLLKQYPKFKSKIVNTGSPRFDFYKPFLLKKKKNKKKFILISSNFGTVLERKRFWDRIDIERKAYFKEFNGSNEEERLYGEFSHTIFKIYKMIKLVRHLTNKYKKENFIFRPHPIESIKGWKILFGDIKNLQIVREGSLVDWINDSKVLIQSGCFSAIEASLVGKNIISFQPAFNEKFDKYFPSSLGFYCKNISEVDKKLSFCLQEKEKLKFFRNRNLNKVKKRLNFSQNKKSCFEIIENWNNLLKYSKSNKNLEISFDSQLYIKSIFFNLKSMLRKFIKNTNIEQDAKFPKLDIEDVKKKKIFLINKVNLKKEIKIKQIDDYSCLISL